VGKLLLALASGIAIAVLSSATGCGRIGYDPRGASTPDGSTSRDSSADAMARACTIDSQCAAGERCSAGTCIPRTAYGWDRTFSGTGLVFGSDVAVGATGTIVLVGGFIGSADFGGGLRTSAGAFDAFVVALDGTGGYLWDRTYGGALDGDAASSVAIGSDGNLFVGGGFQGVVDFGGGARTSAGRSDVFVLGLSAGGDYLWDRTFGAAQFDNLGGLIRATAASDVIAAGSFEGNVDFGSGNRMSAGVADAYVASFSMATGALSWVTTVGGRDIDAAQGVAASSSGDVFVSGSFSGTADFGGGVRTSNGSTDDFVLGLTAAGAYRWDRVFGGTGLEPAGGITTTQGGEVIAVGEWNSDVVDFGGGARTSAGSADAFVLALDQGGAYRWDRVFGAASVDSIAGVVAESTMGALAAGWFFDGPIDFGGGARTSAGKGDGFVIELREDGSYGSDRTIGGPENDTARRVVQVSGGLLVVGGFSGAVDFGGGAREGGFYPSATTASAYVLFLRTE